MEDRVEQIVNYINNSVNRIYTTYGEEYDLEPKRAELIDYFSSVSNSFETLKPLIDKELKDVEFAILRDKQDYFVMSDYELQRYGEIKSKLQAQKKPEVSGPTLKLQPKKKDNKGYISFVLILCTVLAVVVSLVIVLINVLF